MSTNLRILYIVPTKAPLQHILTLKEVIKSAARSDSKVDIAEGTEDLTNLEYHFYEHLALDDIMSMVLNAQKEGYNAAIIGCFYDPGLREAREIVEMPVVGVCEASLHIASMLGHHISVIVGRRKWIPKMSDNVMIYGFSKKISWRAMNKTVDQMLWSLEKVKQAALQQAKKAVEEDSAEVIVLGCTGMGGLFKEIQNKLGVPVIDPIIASIKVAELMADLKNRFNISHSKVYDYEAPPTKKLVAFSRIGNSHLKITK